MTHPTFSVVIAAYNAERTIEETINSVLAQADEDFELIIIDDGSEDLTLPFALRKASSRTQILAHAWPGNVRELQNSLRRAIVTAPGNEIEIDIPHGATRRATDAPPATFPSGQEIPVPAAMQGRAPIDPSGLDGLTLAEVERLVIEAAIERHNGNITQAAKSLAVNPSTIYRKLEKWNG